jgi:hypothetical protein
VFHDDFSYVSTFFATNDSFPQPRTIKKQPKTKLLPSISAEMKPSCFSIFQKNCFLDPKPARLYGKLSSQFNFEAFAKLAPKLHATTRANSLRFILAFFVAPSSHSIEYCMTAEPSCLRPKRFGSRKSENPLHEPGLRESRRKRLLPLYSSHPANFRLPASSQSERFSLATHQTLKSPMF